MSLSCSWAFTFHCLLIVLPPKCSRPSIEPLGIIPGTNKALSDVSAFAMRRNKPWTRWEVVWWNHGIRVFFCCIWFCRPSSTKNQVSMYNVSIWVFHLTFYCKCTLIKFTSSSSEVSYRIELTDLLLITCTQNICSEPWYYYTRISFKITINLIDK